jgi:hypothetical protein
MKKADNYSLVFALNEWCSFKNKAYNFEHSLINYAITNHRSFIVFNLNYVHNKYQN